MKVIPERPTPWVMIPRPQAGARMRLLAFPHAGGGASSYFGWGAGLAPAGIEVRAVQYPGRETRWGEPCLADVAEMVHAIVEQWELIAGTGPAALFGHSMGAILAYEVAVALVRRGTSPPPLRLLVSGHHAPALPYRAPQLRAMRDDELVPAVARQFGGIPAELQNDPEVADLIRPVLRADLTLVETYQWRPAPPLPIGISALGGEHDPWATPAELAEWKGYTTGDFKLRLYPGDHFFVQAQRERVWADLVTDLAMAGDA